MANEVLVDLVRFELTTSSMPWKRAPNCATGPRSEYGPGGPLNHAFQYSIPAHPRVARCGVRPGGVWKAPPRHARVLDGPSLAPYKGRRTSASLGG